MTHFRIPVQENSWESNFEPGNKIHKINEHPPFCLDSFCCEDQLSLAPTLPTWPRRSTRSTVDTSLLFFLPICQLGDLRHHRMPCAQAVNAFLRMHESLLFLYLKTIERLAICWVGAVPAASATAARTAAGWPPPLFDRCPHSPGPAKHGLPPPSLPGSLFSLLSRRRAGGTLTRNPSPMRMLGTP